MRLLDPRVLAISLAVKPKAKPMQIFFSVEVKFLVAEWSILFFVNALST